MCFSCTQCRCTIISLHWGQEARDQASCPIVLNSVGVRGVVYAMWMSLVWSPHRSLVLGPKSSGSSCVLVRRKDLAQNIRPVAYALTRGLAHSRTQPFSCLESTRRPHHAGRRVNSVADSVADASARRQQTDCQLIAASRKTFGRRPCSSGRRSDSHTQSGRGSPRDKSRITMGIHTAYATH